MAQTPERHPRTLAVMAFTLVFWLTLFVVAVVLVGAFNVAPRSAALFALAPAIVLGGVCAAIRPLRRLFGLMFALG